MADNSGIYWNGADGNIYYNSAGATGGQTQQYQLAPGTDAASGGQALNALGYQQIADPNPPTTTTNPGATGTTTPSGPTAAQLAAQANYNSLRTADTNAIQSNIGSNASGYNQGILDAFNSTGGFNSQQNSINAAGVQNELSRDQGLQGVRDMVSNGVQGAGIVLDNAGAGTSSAGDAVARAYGIQGRQQASHVGNQYAQGQNTISSNQNNLNTAENNFATVDTPAKKAQTINDIVQSATQALTYLNIVAGQTANPAQMGDINAQIAAVRAQATDALSKYDVSLAQQMASNTPSSQEANQAKASGLFAAGTAPESAFNFTNVGPAQLQNTGPSASSLPIFIAPSNKTNLPTAV